MVAKATSQSTYQGQCKSCGGAFITESLGPPACAFPKCKKTMPTNDDRPADGWAYITIVRYYHKTIRRERLWTCPAHSMTIAPRQIDLLEPRP